MKTKKTENELDRFWADNHQAFFKLDILLR